MAYFVMPLTSTGATGWSSSTGRYRGLPKIWRVDVYTTVAVAFSRRSSSRNAELAGGVHVEVEQRVVHRVDVAHLPGEVEHHVGRDRRRPHIGAVDVADVGLHTVIRASASV